MIDASALGAAGGAGATGTGAGTIGNASNANVYVPSTTAGAGGGVQAGTGGVMGVAAFLTLVNTGKLGTPLVVGAGGGGGGGGGSGGQAGSRGGGGLYIECGTQEQLPISLGCS